VTEASAPAVHGRLAGDGGGADARATSSAAQLAATLTTA